VLDQRRRGAHDCLVVTLLTALDPLELFETLEPLELLATLEPVELVEVSEPLETVAVLCDASAGSWPLTSSTAISAHVARNSATAPVATRRLIVRVRARRACLTSEAGTGGGLDDIVGSSQLRTAHL
jgi:hypothetical protein